MRIAVVVQRYGDEVLGGAERHARWVAQRLAARHEVEVLTTCAIDHLTWENEYDPGPTELGGLPVRRFPVARRRSPEGLDALSVKVHYTAHTDADERRWMDEHGPVTPGLIRHLEAETGRYDALVFFSYRHWTTYHGVRVAPRRSLLVPTAENDPSVRLRLFRGLFRRPAAIVFNSPEERDLLAAVSGRELRGEVVGVGVEGAELPAPEEIRQRLDVIGEFVVYVGRIERDKGCSRLFADFVRYVQEQAPNLNLVLVGKAVLPIPVHVNVAHLGVLTEPEKLSVIGASRLLVNPSPHDGLSVSLLQAWKMGRPALVNGRCDVLRAQVQRAGGGLYYTSYEEFAEGMTWLRTHAEEAEAMGRAGHAYAQRNHSWDVVMAKYDRLLALAAGTSL